MKTCSSCMNHYDGEFYVECKVAKKRYNISMCKNCSEDNGIISPGDTKKYYRDTNLEKAMRGELD